MNTRNALTSFMNRWHNEEVTKKRHEIAQLPLVMLALCFISLTWAHDKIDAIKLKR